MDSWARRWTYCTRCEKITSHTPHFQEWGPASPKCEVCGDVNLFKDFKDIKCNNRRYLWQRQMRLQDKK